MNFSKYLLYTWVGFQGIRSWKTVFDYCLIVNNGYYITKVFFFFLFVNVDLCVCDRARFSSSKSFSYTVIINERKSGIQYCYIFQKLFLTFHWIHLQILIIHSLVQYSFINNILTLTKRVKGITTYDGNGSEMSRQIEEVENWTEKERETYRTRYYVDDSDFVWAVNQGKVFLNLQKIEWAACITPLKN